MYCRNCGKKLEDDRELCAECEAKLNTTEVKPDEKIEVVQDVVNQEEVNSNPIVENNVNSTNSDNNNTTSNNTSSNQANVEPERKSKLEAGLFGIFLGALGIHNFYLGYTSKAVAQLLITVLSCGMLGFVSALWGLIEGILIFTGDIKTDANGVALKD